MPTYLYVCPTGHKFDRVRSMTESGLGFATCACGEISRRDYAGEKPLPAVIDGEHSGYYPKEWGLPPDPTNPLKSIMPAKRRAEDGMKRVEEKSGGAFGWVKP